MKTSLFRRCAALGLAVILALPSVALGHAGDQKLRTRTPLVEGLNYVNTITADAAGRQESFALEYTPGQATGVIAVQSSGTVYGLATIMQAVERAQELGYHVLAAVNTDYFSPVGVPMGLVIENGIYKSQTGAFPAIAFVNGAPMLVENATVALTLQNQTTGNVVTPQVFNKTRTATGGMYLLNRDFSTVSTRTSGEGWFVRMTVLEGVMTVSGTMQLQVTELVRGTEPLVIGENEFILTAADGAGYGEAFDSFQLGDLITLTTSCVDENLANAQWATGTGDLMVKDGALTNSSVWQHSREGRAPRTALGVTADGRLITYVVDGRQSGHSAGLSQVELANEMLRQGCVWAVNLDGGGSSSVLAKMPADEARTVMNRPSDGRNRTCATFLLFVVPTPAGEPQSLSRLASLLEGSVVLSGSSLSLDAVGTLAATDANLNQLLAGGQISDFITYQSSLGLGSLDGATYTAGSTAGTDIVLLNSPDIADYRQPIPALSGNIQLHVVTALTALTVTEQGKTASLTSLTMDANATIQLSATGSYWNRPAMRDSAVVVWAVSDSASGSISEDGLFTAGRKAGTITATAGGITTQINFKPSGVFEDVPENHWAYTAIEYCYDNRIITGVSDSQFGLGRNIQRCDFALMLHRIAGNHAATSSVSFSDVNPNDYFAAAVAWAAQTGVATGGGDGSFGAKNSITREQAFTMLGRALPLIGVPLPAADPAVLDRFPDKNQVADYALNHTAALVSAGLVSGSGQGINPKGTMSREEMAVLLYRALTLSVEPPVAAESITLSQSEAVLQAAERLQLNASLLPVGSGGTVQWSSDNPTVAAVSATGLVENRLVAPQGVTATAVITATVGNLSANCTVTCHPSDGSELLPPTSEPLPEPIPEPAPVPEPMPVPPAPVSDTSIAVGTVINASAGLNLREAPSTAASVLTRLSNGAALTVRSVSDGWCHVSAQTDAGLLTGYVSVEYVNLTYRGTVNAAAGLNLREAASTDAAIITRLPQGCTLLILSASDSWFQVSTQFDGQNLTGYVSAEYVTTARPTT